MANQYIPYILKTTCDSLAAMFILFPFYFTGDRLPPIGSLLLIAIVTGGVIGYFLEEKPNKTLFVGMIAVACFGLGLLFSLPVFLIITTFLYMLRKGFSYAEDGIVSQNGTKLFLVTLIAIGLFVYAHIINYQSAEVIFTVYLLLLLTFYLQRFVNGWLKSKLSTKQRMGFVYWGLLALLGIGVVSFFIACLLPFLRQILIIIFTAPLWLLTWILYPVLNWLFHLDLEIGSLPEITMENQLLNHEMQTAELGAREAALEGNPEMVLVLLLVLALIIFITLVFKGKIVQVINQGKKEAAEISYGQPDRSFSYYKKWNFSSEPGQQIRKQVWNLEKYAVKKEINRRWNESLAEWFERVGIHSKKTEKYIRIYNECRYGEKEIADDDAQWFISYTQIIRNGLRQAIKEKKKGSKK